MLTTSILFIHIKGFSDPKKNSEQLIWFETENTVISEQFRRWVQRTTVLIK
jgi:hypothetical protein